MRLIHPRPNVTEEGRASTGAVSPRGLVRHREHWDGRVDAKVLPGTIHRRVKPKWSETLAFLELEDATAELRRAQLSKDRDTIRRARYRFEQARHRFSTVKFGERIVEAIRE